MWMGLSDSLHSNKVASNRKDHSLSKQISQRSAPPSAFTQSSSSSSTPRIRPSFLSSSSERPSTSTDEARNGGENSIKSQFARIADVYWPVGPDIGGTTRRKPSFRSTSNVLDDSTPSSSTSAQYTETSTSTSSSSSSTPSSSAPSPSENAESSGVSWASLLAKIQGTQDNYPSLPPKYAPKTVPSVTTGPGGSFLDPIRSEDSGPRSLHDRLFESQAETRRYSLSLQEEVRYLESPAQALRWMQDRIFSKADDSLMSQMTNPDNPASSSLQYMYGDLLVDITAYLRNSEHPETSFLPLQMAKTHSTSSYLYGCTAKLYALNIRTKWELYGDIEGVLELMKDMERGAVHYNIVIQDHVKNISLAVMADRLRAQKLVEEEEGGKTEQKEKPKIKSKSKLIVAKEVSEFIEDTPQDQSIKEEEKGEADYAKDAAIERKLFFSDAQRRALGEIERMVVEDRQRYYEAKAREDNLRANIRAQSDTDTSAYYGEGMADGEEGESERISDVNALIKSYGKAIPFEPFKARYNQQEQQQSQIPGYRSRNINKRKGISPSSSSTRETPILSVNAIPELSTNQSFDILNEAIAEASREPQSEGRRRSSRRQAVAPKEVEAVKREQVDA